MSVDPSHRGKGVGKRMVKALKELHKDTHFVPNENTVAFCDKCHINESMPKLGNNLPVCRT
ncbi:GNAT family N-acetyltransferase [Bacillus benzoevorans]|uniref:GNAT family N-acetyltransferase n=1 Tax=Bacillus benzoevorans TaxID=1456 RepID=UPI00366F4E30